MRDEWFIRGKVPMTKSEVRAVSISKLELEPDSVLWDVGAGTGSVSVEASFFCPHGHVYAFEKNPEAIRLMEENRKKAGQGNITIIEGTAPESFSCLENPALSGAKKVTHAFLGGTNGWLDEILDALFACNPDVRVVMNVIALESLSSILTSLEHRGIEPEIISLSVARGEKAGNYHLMKGQNPVYIISFGGLS
ncbi:MAG: precorrin-6Y C5,15-methyltransferase (decarboxylating) subunit CbiT [Clostridium sp.]|nr:precorrin-6Y C5,15-methyltransferase (decarboxylating) subunit CbiT [Clostridium sp.]